MHIKSAQSALLSNHEVFLHLQAEQAEYNGTDGTSRKRKPPPGLQEIIKDGIHYFSNPDSPLPTLTTTHPTRPLTLYKGSHSLFRALAPKYRLNKTEYLQIYNIRPRSHITLQLVIEEAGVRFTEDELEDILGILARVFDEEESGIREGVEEEKLAGLGGGVVVGGVSGGGGGGGAKGRRKKGN
ncbi:hypothetical protein DM02DRAFT_134400 [Periconia macrospinosa]|uniref:DNA-directed RNA polymerase III subunit RPC9 n=1 Tax=Periconia macrospinosa TaxID=97972 RepID=A0A2V1E321_9PLEO|nr:hypothetical protein DM02DRAFT_134400 [Periconia macrospinosa]